MSATAAEREDAVGAGEPWPLPQRWAWARLGELGKWTGGGTPSKSVENYWQQGTVPWVSPKDMKFEVIRETEDTITEEAVQGSATKFVAPGSILMVMRSGILRHTFPVAINADRVTVNQDLRALTPPAVLDPYFLAHYLRSIQRRILHNCSKDGTTVQSVDAAALERVWVPVAPETEQRRIVARINELFAEIAEGEAALERARSGLDALRRALLKAAVTGELTREWRDKCSPKETGSELLFRLRKRRNEPAASVRARRNEESRPVDRSSLPELPEGWAWANLCDCISHLTSGSRDWSQFYDRGSAIFVMAQNIRPGRYNHSYIKNVDPPPGDAETIRTLVQKNDLLVTIVGANTGDVCRVDFDAKDFYICQSVALIRPSIPEISEFLELYFVAPDGGRGEFEKVIYGAGRPHLSFDQLLYTPVPLPSIMEMRQIVQCVRNEESDALDEKEFNHLHRDIFALRQSILKSAFEGRLVPQDPSDEPASALLARLRAEVPPAPRRGRGRKAAS